MLELWEVWAPLERLPTAQEGGTQGQERRRINAVDEAQQGRSAAEYSTVTIGCLRRSGQEPSQLIGACATRPRSHWNGHTLTEVTRWTRAQLGACAGQTTSGRSRC